MPHCHTSILSDAFRWLARLAGHGGQRDGNRSPTDLRSQKTLTEWGGTDPPKSWARYWETRQFFEKNVVPFSTNGISASRLVIIWWSIPWQPRIVPLPMVQILCLGFWPRSTQSKTYGFKALQKDSEGWEPFLIEPCCCGGAINFSCTCSESHQPTKWKSSL